MYSSKATMALGILAGEGKTGNLGIDFTACWIVYCAYAIQPLHLQWLVTVSHVIEVFLHLTVKFV